MTSPAVYHLCAEFFTGNIKMYLRFISFLHTDMQGSFRLCNWLSLRRLVSFINHLPPACWSTFWKSNFKQQLSCRFDIMDNESYFFCALTYAIIYVLIHQIIFRFYLLKYSLFFSSTLVLTSSIDVVFILSILYDTDSSNPSPWKKRTCLFFIVNMLWQGAKT